MPTRIHLNSFSYHVSIVCGAGLTRLECFLFGGKPELIARSQIGTRTH